MYNMPTPNSHIVNCYLPYKTTLVILSYDVDLKKEFVGVLLQGVGEIFGFDLAKLFF